MTLVGVAIVATTEAMKAAFETVEDAEVKAVEVDCQGIPEDETEQVLLPNLYARSVRALQSDGVVKVLGADVETRDGACTASVTKFVVSALASIGSDVSAAGVLSGVVLW
ncbi:hypothetical protein PInf_015100 [Phytophthora infestans]|nr:hypothetical protein PInf_015100 [Phytophthora infestans]